MIDLDQIGPDWELAKVHAKSTVAGRAPGDTHEVSRCPCCFRKIVTEPIGLFSNSKELEVLGYAFPLYFKFLKYAMILILFQICSYNILQLTKSINQNQQQCSAQGGQNFNTVCSNYLVWLSSLSTQITNSQQMMRVCSFVIQLFLLIYIRHKMTNTLKYYRQRKTTISDYSILIKDLPEVPDIKSKIKRIFEEYFYGDYKTEEIILIGFLQEYYELKQKKQEILRKKVKIMNGDLPDDQELASCDAKLAEVQQSIDREVENTVASTKRDQLRCQKAIVVLQSEAVKETVIRDFQRFLKKPEKRKKLKQILGSEDIDYIRIIEAPEPDQIIWSHINVPRKKRRIKQVLGWVFTFLFMAAITAVFYFIIREKSLIVEHVISLLKEQNQGENVNVGSVRTKAAALVYFVIFAIVLLNKLVISKFLHLISSFQKHPTYSKEEYYFSIKYTITIFLTTAVLTLLVEDATLHNIQEDYGLIEEESIMFFVSAIFVPFLWLVNPFQMSKYIKRKMNYGKPHLTQGEANNLMMDEPASLGKLFAETIEIIWFTYMYSSVIPLGGILVLGGFMVNYWIVKHSILRRSSIDHQVSGGFITMALTLLDISLIMKPAGQLIFDFQIRSGCTVESIVCTIIGLIYCFLPMNLILQRLHKEQFLLSQKTYQQSKSNFATNYQMLHPIYSLSKIYIEKQTQKLNLYTPADAAQERRPTKKLAINIEMALLRRSSQFKLQPKILPAKEQIIAEESSIVQSMGESNIHQRIL